MDVRIVDLDGSIPAQRELLAAYQPRIIAMVDWGPSIRMACGFRRFRRFQATLDDRLQTRHDESPVCTLFGSGDFHHVSLALLRRQTRPFNLLVLDNHPDWMRRVPFLHCGTWLYHAARLQHVQRIFHLGGDVDFDNSYRWLAPWHQLRQGKIITIPARRGFVRGSWGSIPCEPLRDDPDRPISPRRLEVIVEEHRIYLRTLPLYISIDKDVLVPDAAAVNWDSGHLTLAELCDVLRAFAGAAGAICGMDCLGDWSPVAVRGGLRHVMHWAMHEHRSIDSRSALRANQRSNLAILDAVNDGRRRGWKTTRAAA
jgi:hypothetical protein